MDIKLNTNIKSSPVNSTYTVFNDEKSGDAVNLDKNLNVNDIANTSSGSNVAVSKPSQEKNDYSSIDEYREQIKKEQEEEAERKAEENVKRAKEAVEALNSRHLALRFEESKDFENSQVINVVDTNSDEIIRQIPTDEFLKVSQVLNDYYERKLKDKLEKETAAYNEENVSNVNANAKRGTLLDFQA